MKQPTVQPDTAAARPKPVPQQLVGSYGGKRRRLALWSGCATIAVLVVTGSVLFYLHLSTGALPTSVTKNTGFTLYYPSPIPDGYSYRKGSAKTDNGYVFFTLQNSGNSITVDEQAAPATPPNLNQLAGFTSLKTIAGNAAVGVSNKQPIVIITSNTTLISITGQRGMPQDIVAEVAQNMRSLSQ